MEPKPGDYIISWDGDIGYLTHYHTELKGWILGRVVSMDDRVFLFNSRFNIPKWKIIEKKEALARLI